MIARKDHILSKSTIIILLKNKILSISIISILLNEDHNKIINTMSQYPKFQKETKLIRGIDLIKTCILTRKIEHQTWIKEIQLRERKVLYWFNNIPLLNTKKSLLFKNRDNKTLFHQELNTLREILRDQLLNLKGLIKFIATEAIFLKVLESLLILKMLNLKSKIVCNRINKVEWSSKKSLRFTLTKRNIQVIKAWEMEITTREKETKMRLSIVREAVKSR